MRNVIFVFAALLFSNLTQAQVNPLIVKIGNQKWMVKNLDVDHYRNGDPIPYVSDPTEWVGLTTGAWCYYNNDPSNNGKYGKLYNWYAVTDPRGLAPKGYHIPTFKEWTTLDDFLGEGASTKLKSTTGWIDDEENNSGNGTNSYGFQGLPAGCRDEEGEFLSMNENVYWWSSTDAGEKARSVFLSYSSGDNIVKYFEFKFAGYSVRCIKD